MNIKFDGTLSLVREELEPPIPEETPTLETAAAAAEERFTESKIAKWSRRRSNPKKLNKRRRGRERGRRREREEERETEREINIIDNQQKNGKKQIELDKVKEKVKREKIISQVKKIVM